MNPAGLRPGDATPSHAPGGEQALTLHPTTRDGRERHQSTLCRLFSGGTDNAPVKTAVSSCWTVTVWSKITSYL
ncbi:hypothetical protein KCU67_g64, partial [Aureobasidium melanogenum]